MNFAGHNTFGLNFDAAFAKMTPSNLPAMMT